MKFPHPFRFYSNQKLLIVALLAIPIGANAEYHTVTIGMKGFQPLEITINTGDTVTWMVEEGDHVVVAEDGSFKSGLLQNSGAIGETATYSHTFNEPGEVPYTDALHRLAYERAQLQPLVTVKGEAVSTGMDINFGHGGSWYNSAENGQGFSLEVVPDSAALTPGSGQLVAYWFTFAKGAPGGASKLRWFEGLGPIDGPDAMLAVYQVSGGVFDDPAQTTTEQIGTAVAHFDSCTEGAFSYSLDLNGDGTEESSGDIAITRITPDVLCEQLNAN